MPRITKIIVEPWDGDADHCGECNALDPDPSGQAPCCEFNGGYEVATDRTNRFDVPPEEWGCVVCGKGADSAPWASVHDRPFPLHCGKCLKGWALGWPMRVYKANAIKIRAEALAGKHRPWVKCPACRGTGMITANWATRVCENCVGCGRVSLVESVPFLEQKAYDTVPREQALPEWYYPAKLKPNPYNIPDYLLNPRDPIAEHPVAKWEKEGTTCTYDQIVSSGEIMKCGAVAYMERSVGSPAPYRPRCDHHLAISADRKCYVHPIPNAPTRSQRIEYIQMVRARDAKQEDLACQGDASIHDSPDVI